MDVVGERLDYRASEMLERCQCYSRPAFVIPDLYMEGRYSRESSPTFQNGAGKYVQSTLVGYRIW